MPVSFHTEDIRFKLSQPLLHKQWVKQVIGQHGKKLGDVSYIFCSDEYLLQINREHLQHDYYTDIITFDYSDNQLISGDLFISVDRVVENAEKEAVAVDVELRRVMIHGILHLLGFKDKTEKDENEMRLQENQALMVFDNLNVPRGT